MGHLRRIWTPLAIICAATWGCDDSGGNEEGGAIVDASVSSLDGSTGGAGGEAGAGGDVGGAGGDVGGAGGDVGGAGGASADAGPEACQAGDVRPCPTGEDACGTGAQRCQEGEWSACEWPEDVCNGEDDDCDGQTDEEHPEVGTPCTEGLGACAVEGTTVCGPSGRGVQCNVSAGDPGVEVCNGIDDDCDGDTDEGADGAPLTAVCYEGPEGTEGIGACLGGQRRCVEGSFGACEDQITPGVELCTPGDEDCDGASDEGYPSLGEACPVGVGACVAEGQWACDGSGAALTCAGEAGAPGEEACTGVDDDCDGSVDEGVQCGCAPDSQRACYGGPEGTAGVGRCAQGVQRCDAEGVFGPCVGEIGPAPERCDGFDDDCDGRTDEGFPALGSTCAVGVGACAVDGFVICDEGGQGTRCDADPNLPGLEICNGVDDDCDGQTDEGLGLGEACAVGVGACEAQGVGICAADGAVICDAIPATPTLEVCNGIDDDCDGDTDEGANGGALLRVCYEGPEGTEGAGRCQGGVQACDDGAFGACQGQILPRGERCDGFDDDCDGQTDEDFDVGAVCEIGVGACAAAGQIFCDINGQAICSVAAGEPVAERCNGADDDCDGVTDEGFEGVGAACTAGLGRCEAAGVGACAADGLSVICDAAPGSPGPEICNGEDDDCDGATDEAIVPVACYGGPEETRRIGLCADGVRRCVEGAFGVCEGEIQPEAEICDGDDNDCDGQTDEAVEVACYDGPAGTAGVGQCAAGVSICDEGTPGGCVGQILPSDEICDGVDNDCDGVVDNGVDCTCEAGARQDCYGGPEGTEGVGLCQGGEQICQAEGGFGACEGQVRPAAEICNGFDDDCDGSTDEAIAGLGEACSRGVGECRRQGQRVCGEGGLICDAEPGPTSREICDGLDNDCDGNTDEGQGIGLICTQGLGLCAAQGTLQCNGSGGVSCTAAVGDPQPEQCDAQDNDCDGTTDEGEGGQPLLVGCYTGPAGTAGVGECRQGEAECLGGGPGFCRDEVRPAAEICDGLDNDCDGRADEGFGVGQACVGGVGECQVGGVIACGEGGGTFCDAEPGAGQAEICDGADNDCDGAIDEAPGGGALSEPCYTGPGGTEGVGQCGAGVRICQGGAYRLCQDEVQPAAERCDGVDNDCDGNTDEGYNLGVNCVVGSGACAALGQQICDDAGGTTCSADAVEPQPELCDGVDNDCDGAVDEAFGNLGQACVSGIGACTGEGTYVCAADGSRTRCDAALGSPSAELCNGIDDDCDSNTDEQAQGDGEACSAGLGECQRAGVQRCDPVFDQLICGASAGDPTDEICDGLDNDCDGLADEDVAGGAACTVGVGACAREGAFICGPDGELACSGEPGAPSGEVCNGIDDDCDGTTDEGFPGLGAACSGGVGRCGYSGVTVCDAGGDIVCSDAGRGPVTEACNGADDDCDGQIDEGFGQLGAGCQVGTGVCTAGGSVVCSGAPDQEALAFEGVRTDLVEADLVEGGFEPCWVEVYEEGQTTITGANPLTGEPGILTRCDEQILLLGCRRIGEEAVSVAAMGDREAILIPSEFADRTPENVHNGVNWYFNNDYSWGFAPAGAEVDVFSCDRVVDDRSGERVCWYTSADKVRPGYRCGADIVNASGIWERFIYQRTGTVTEGAVGDEVCSAEPAPAGDERCNGLDDDCDGRNDEDFALGGACTSGVGACEIAGATVCAADGGTECSADPGAPSPEVCDAVDNDCDGEADEGFDLGGACTSGVGACEAAGDLVCDGAGGVTCDATPNAPQAEACNAFDDDCDGQIDEGVVDCVIYRSCLEAQQAGAVDSGVYVLRPDPDERGYEVWCDMTTDGGGWTTVGSSAVPANGRGAGTLDDRGVAGYDNLRTLAPQGLASGLWRDMRALSDRFDMRFACRDQRAGSAFDAMTVDLSFYDTEWYALIAEADADSDVCLNLAGDPSGPPPRRRNNLTGEVIEADVPWDQGALVSEDSCGDGGDFMIDFTDGGVLGDRSDGTDWGELNGARHCGQANLGTGQWMVLIRER